MTTTKCYGQERRRTMFSFVGNRCGGVSPSSSIMVISSSRNWYLSATAIARGDVWSRGCRLCDNGMLYSPIKSVRQSRASLWGVRNSSGPPTATLLYVMARINALRNGGRGGSCDFVDPSVELLAGLEKMAIASTRRDKGREHPDSVEDREVGGF